MYLELKRRILTECRNRCAHKAHEIDLAEDERKQNYLSEAAIRKLANEGLVVIEPSRRTYVIYNFHQDLEDVFEVRGNSGRTRSYCRS